LQPLVRLEQRPSRSREESPVPGQPPAGLGRRRRRGGLRAPVRPVGHGARCLDVQPFGVLRLLAILAASSLDAQPASLSPLAGFLHRKLVTCRS